jgi:hypothetical protein
MSKFSLEIINRDGHELWDELVRKSSNGTLYQEQKFLSYHGKKFHGNVIDLLIRHGDKNIGLVSFLKKEQSFATPYGASYGGFVFTKPPTYSHSCEIISLVTSYLKSNFDAESITVSPTPDYSSSIPNDTFLFAMLEAGFKLVSRDVCSVVDLSSQTTDGLITSKAQNMIRKARKNDVLVMQHCSLDQFWELLSDTYKKHGVAPTHTLDELRTLNNLYPDRINFLGVEHEGQPIAAICEFVLNERVKSAFYFGQREDKKELQGLSLAIEIALDRAIQDKYDFYDFGTSTVNMQARPNIFRFKESFGATGHFREKYILDIRDIIC